MVLPSTLLQAAQDRQLLIELKNGESFQGTLVNIDNWMNITLKQAISTSRDGTKFWKIPEVYIRGTFIKYLRVEDEMLEKAKELAIESDKRSSSSRGGASSSERGGRGGSRGGRGGARGGSSSSSSNDRGGHRGGRGARGGRGRGAHRS